MGIAPLRAPWTQMTVPGRFCCKNRGSEERRLRDLVGAARGCGFDAVVMHATQHTSRAPVVVWRPVWRAVVGSVRSRRE